MVEENYKKEVIRVPCECGCSIFEIEGWDIGNKTEAFYALYYKLIYSNTSIRNALKRKVKLLWCVLTGKEYVFFDIALERKDLEKFRDELSHILEIE